MPVRTKTGNFGSHVVTDTVPKKRKQSRSQNTKHAASSRNKAKEKYRGQGS